jgi:hypothetical protein
MLERVADLIRSTKDGTVRLIRDSTGLYGVTSAGVVIFESRVLAAAEIYYDEEVEKHRSPQRRSLAQERAHFDAQALHSESSARRRAKALYKGGKGGRGGVS